MTIQMPNWPYITPGERPSPAPPDYAAARAEYAGEVRNLAGQWGIPWPPQPLTLHGKIVGYALLSIERQINSFTDHERHRQDRAKFFDLLKRSGYTS